MTTDCNDELAFVCEECYRLVYDDCEPIIIDVGLTPLTQYCFKFYDKFGTTYQFLDATGADGSIIIDETQLPDKLFNPFSGLIELQVFLDCDTNDRVNYTIAYTQFNCILLQNSESVEDNDDISEPSSNDTVSILDSEGDLITEVQCGDSYTISNESCADATAVLKDSANTTISTTSIPSGSSVNISAPDATISNSDDSYVSTAKSNGTKEIPDITLTQPNGDIETHPSVKNLTCDTEVTVITNVDFNIAANLAALRANTDWQSYLLTILNSTEEGIVYENLDIVYNFPQPTGQTTSYTTGDDAYYFTNVWDTYWSTLKVGRIPQLTDFTTLLENNSFGNTSRFTDELGGQTYTNNYIIDHLTGLGWYRVEQAAAVWSSAISNAESFSTLFSDWFIPNRRQLESIINMNATRPLNYAPFSLQTGAAAIRFLWTSTTLTNTTSSAHILIHNNTTAVNMYAMSSQTKATSTNCLSILCRKHF